MLDSFISSAWPLMDLKDHHMCLTDRYNNETVYFFIDKKNTRRSIRTPLATLFSRRSKEGVYRWVPIPWPANDYPPVDFNLFEGTSSVEEFLPS